MSKHLGYGELGQLLQGELKPGEEASVLNEANPHHGHIDAELYQKGQNSRIRRVERAHLNPILPWDELKNYNP